MMNIYINVFLRIEISNNFYLKLAVRPGDRGAHTNMHPLSYRGFRKKPMSFPRVQVFTIANVIKIG